MSPPEEAVAVAKKVLETLAFSEIEHPALFAEARAVFGLKEPCPPCVSGKRLTLPADDLMHAIVVEYETVKKEATKAAEEMKVRRKQIVAAMGDADELYFHDGMSVCRKVIVRESYSVSAVTYDTLKVTGLPK